ncbi:Protein translocase subunit SecY [bioreactor metagenome]|uniref:Protein translocase subunit SecY n=1 Tax=bioreactor metagenome TaxID=1076179 RepID=A0A644T674_9ZZZZ|nr:preprotein translocase subunit SecY [Candidatus Elulimicrobiales bacterium]
MKTLKRIWQDKVLRNRILFVVLILAIVRFLSSIPIPGVDREALSVALSNNNFLGFLNIFSGGGLSSFSIIMLGVSPYITASIIMQLLTVLVPKFKELYHEEGEAGRRKFTQYSRLLTVPLAVIQGYALLALLTAQNIIPKLSTPDMILNIIIITAGAVLIMWLGEQITDYGIGNGASMIIFAGIVASLPTSVIQVMQTFDSSMIPMIIAVILLVILTIAGIVFVTEAERQITITYSKQASNFYGSTGITSTYLPIRLNQAGVIPIIFAVSLLLFPQMIAQFFGNSANASLQSIAQFFTNFLSNTFAYGVVYFLLVVLFTYFYTAVTFDTTKTSENLQKSGAFIPGFRPGVATTDYIGGVLSKITFFGAIFLGIIAILPIILQAVTGVQAFAIGGTSLLIAVSVVIDFVKKVDAQLTMREY